MGAKETPYWAAELKAEVGGAQWVTGGRGSMGLSVDTFAGKLVFPSSDVQ